MTNPDDYFKLPRLYLDAPLAEGLAIPLTEDHVHYFKTVLRRQDGDQIRVFNGRDGEFLATLQTLAKKSGFAQLEKKIKPQPAPSPGVHLFFAPIKKSSLDWLIEKAVELGATDLHPIITQNTEVRDVNLKRLQSQMLEAAEQCERLDRPALHDPVKLHDITKHLPENGKTLACLERGETLSITSVIPEDQPVAIIIGPEGGFTAGEAAWLRTQPTITAVSLGPRILRCETAACVALSAVMLRN